MAIDWSSLEKGTEELTSLILDKDVDGKTVTSVVFSGLRVRLSEIVSHLLQVDEAASISIWVDTLVVDFPTFPAMGSTIVAREVDISFLGGAPIPLAVPQGSALKICELLIGGTSSGPEEFMKLTTDAQVDSSLLTVKSSAHEPNIYIAEVLPDGTFTPTEQNDVSYFQDLIDRPYAINALKSSFWAASILLEEEDPEAIRTAQSMLQWVALLAGKVLSQGEELRSNELGTLYSQASALLTTINLKSGIHYVPILNKSFYENEISKQLEALTSYESHFQSLTVSEDIKGAIQDVSTSLQKVSAIQQSPLQTDLDQVTSNAQKLGASIQRVHGEFYLNWEIANGKRNEMEAKIKDVLLRRYLQAYVDTAINAAKLGGDLGKMAGGDATAGASAASDAVATFKSGYDMYKSIKKMENYDPNDQLIVTANKLVESQQAIVDSFYSSSGIWDEIKDGKPISTRPLSPSMDLYDTELVWNTYQIELERFLTNQGTTTFGNDGYTGVLKIAAENYLASLKVVVQYGKALNSKMVAYSQLLSRAIVLKSEIAANNSIEKTWEDLAKKTSSEKEQLAALKGVIKGKMNSIKRSIYVAYSNYKEAHLYVYFQSPPENARINMSMDAAAMKTSFANVTSWVGRIKTSVSDSDLVVVPQEVNFQLEFPIYQQGGSTPLPTDEVYAILSLTPETAPTISVSIPRGISQLSMELPQGGQGPIWVKAGKFIVEGCSPNQHGKVMFLVHTSGSYQNGYPSKEIFSFETKGLIFPVTYQASEADNKAWEIESEDYMTPALYTQWTITFDENGGDPQAATSLKMEFTAQFIADLDINLS